MDERSAGQFTRRRFLLGASAMVGVGAFAAACSQAQPSATGAPATATTGAGVTATAAATAGPRRGGTLVAATTSDPPGLDPHKVPQLAAAWIYNNMYAPLLVLDSKFTPKPHIAESWEVSPDRQTYTFKIRSDVKFHDGTDLTADDVRFSLDRVRDPKTASPFAGDLVMIDQVSAPDKSTVKVTLKYPTALFLKAVAQERAAMVVSKAAVEKSGDVQKIDGGSGPFKLGAFDANNFYQVDRFAGYFEKDVPYIDAQRWRVLGEPATRQAQMRTGQLDWSSFGKPEWDQLASDGAIQRKSFPNGQVTCIHINYKNKPLDDARVRLAMSMAVDRREIINKVYGAGEPSANVPVNHPSGYGLTKEELPAYFEKPDVAGAKKLLAEAGLANGFKASMMVNQFSNPEWSLVPQLLQQQWKQIGIDLELKPYGASAAYVADFNGAKWDMIYDLFGFRVDPDGYFVRYLRSGAAVGGVPRIVDQQIDSLVDKGQRQEDGAERRQTYVAAQKRVLEIAPLIFVVSLVQFEALSKRVQGYEPVLASSAGPKTAFVRSWLTQ